jgi:hypothetical protein
MKKCGCICRWYIRILVLFEGQVHILGKKSPEEKQAQEVKGDKGLTMRRFARNDSNKLKSC